MNQIKFVKLTISDRILIAYEDEVQDVNDWPYFIETCLSEGYKVSLVSKADSGSVGLTITDNRDKSANKGKCFSQWSGDLGRSAQKAAIILLVSGQGEWELCLPQLRSVDESLKGEYEEWMRTKKKNARTGGYEDRK